MKEYETGCLIHAAPEAVWRVLTDAAGYEAWNPEIVGVAGKMAMDERIKARVKVKGRGGKRVVRSVPMRVTAFDPPRRMEWVGGLPFGLFVGRRTFTVTARDGGGEFAMHLAMSGPLSGPIEKSVGDRQPEIDSFARGLKDRVERELMLAC
jgi:uncharacterized protein YndB with AHSA1/START domain